MAEYIEITRLMGNSNGEHQPNSETSFHIPFDLFVSKKQKKGFGTGSFIRFTDSFGNLVFKVERPPNNEDKSSTAPHSVKLLSDGSGKTLISILKVKTGSWQGFRVHDNREELIFRAEERQNKLTKTEFDIFLIGENNQRSDFKMKGCPFKRSCTVYKDDSILAETSLMYKLGIKKAFVPRSRFRVTLFPGFSDHGLVVALIVIFFDGRKLWV